MFTGRSEFRLSLRSDNADLRLTERGYEIGCVGQSRYDKFKMFRDNYEAVIEHLKSISNTSYFWKKTMDILPFGSNKPTRKNIFEILQFEGINLSMFQKYIDKKFEFVFNDKNLMDRVKIQSVYTNDELRQFEEIENIRSNETIRIPENFDYKILNISSEAKEKLEALKPTSLGQASRIQGISAAAIFKLFNYFKKIN